MSKYVREPILNRFGGVAAVVAIALVAACGGGGDDSVAAPVQPAAQLNAAPTDAPFVVPVGPQLQQHLDYASANAGNDPQMIANRRILCYVVDHTGFPPEILDMTVVKPTKLFDDFSYIGQVWVGQYALKTANNNVFLVDTLSSASDVDNITVPGFTALGLDPHKIVAAMPTHGHFDHFGGAAQLVSKFGVPHVWIGSADKAAVTAATDVLDNSNKSPISFTVDGTTLTLLSTPGHTPGTFSGIVPVTQGASKYKLAFWGGTAEPATLVLSQAYQDSAERMYAMARDQKVDGTFHTHAWVDGSMARINQINAGATGKNPFLTGTATALRMLAVLRECSAANVAKIDATAVITPWRVTTTTTTAAKLDPTGTKLDVTARVKDPFATVSSMTVNFALTGSAAGNCTTVTDSSGNASCTISANSTVKSGDSLTVKTTELSNATAVWLASDDTVAFK